MRVEPFREMKDIKNIKKLLTDNPRDLLLFTTGINSGLRVQDLLSFKVSQFMNVSVGDRIYIKEKKTGKDNVLIVNKEIYSCFSLYCDIVQPEPHFFLFKSRKGKNYPITTYRVTRLVQHWADSLNIKGNYGAHSLRKTFCLIQRVQFGTPWETLCKRLNHSSPSITRRYLGVKEEEVEKILLHNI